MQLILSNLTQKIFDELLDIHNVDDDHKNHSGNLIISSLVHSTAFASVEPPQINQGLFDHHLNG